MHQGGAKKWVTEMPVGRIANPSYGAIGTWLFRGGARMRRLRIRCLPTIFMIMLPILCCAWSAADDASGPADSDTWPLFRGDTCSTGVAKGELPATLALRLSSGMEGVRFALILSSLPVILFFKRASVIFLHS